MIDLKSLYPELVEFDGLPFALQSKLSGSFSNLQVTSGLSFSKWNEMKDVLERQGLYHIPSRILAQSGKGAEVDLAIEQKLYILTLADKSEKAKYFIEVDTLDKAITFLSRWFSDNKENPELESLEHFTTLLNLDDDLQYIKGRWLKLHRNSVNFPSLTGLLVPLFKQALNDPILSQVAPYTSLVTLRLSRCTEFPFLAKDYPIAEPLYYFGHYYRYIVHKQNLEEAERLISRIPSEYGFLIRFNNGVYEFSSRQGEQLFKGDSVELLKFIVDYTYGRYIVMDGNGNSLETKNAKGAVEFLRNALPLNGYPSIRGSADDINN